MTDQQRDENDNIPMCGFCLEPWSDHTPEERASCLSDMSPDHHCANCDAMQERIDAMTEEMRDMRAEIQDARRGYEGADFYG